MCACECMFVCMPTPNYIILQVRLGTERGGWRGESTCLPLAILLSVIPIVTIVTV